MRRSLGWRQIGARSPKTSCINTPNLAFPSVPSLLLQSFTLRRRVGKEGRNHLKEGGEERREGIEMEPQQGIGHMDNGAELQ